MENCPYCNAEQEINHDDGYGYSEGEIHQQQCYSCGKTFTYTTSISFYYELEMAECLNDGSHVFKPTNTIPRQFTEMECEICGERRKPTQEELERILNPQPEQSK